MKDQLINGSLSILVQAILSILGLVTTVLIGMLASYLSKKKEALVHKVGVENYNATYNIAKSVFYMVEQMCKSQTVNSEDKARVFDSFLLQRIPALTQDELDHFRESIIGEFNTNIKPLLLDSTISNKDKIV